MPLGVQAADQRGATINLLDGTLTGALAGNTSGTYKIAPFTQLELGLEYTMHASQSGKTATFWLWLSVDGTNFQPYSIASDAAPAGGVIVATLYARPFRIDGVAGVAAKRWFAIPTCSKAFYVQAMEDGSPGAFGTFKAYARVSNDTTFR